MQDLHKFWSFDVKCHSLSKCGVMKTTGVRKGLCYKHLSSIDKIVNHSLDNRICSSTVDNPCTQVCWLLIVCGRASMLIIWSLAYCFFDFWSLDFSQFLRQSFCKIIGLCSRGMTGGGDFCGRLYILTGGWHLHGGLFVNGREDIGGRLFLIGRADFGSILFLTDGGEFVYFGGRLFQTDGGDCGDK